MRAGGRAGGQQTNRISILYTVMVHLQELGRTGLGSLQHPSVAGSLPSTFPFMSTDLCFAPEQEGETEQ